MALNAFLTLEGKKQGSIKGSVTQKGREGTIMVIAANHEVLMPMSGGGGAATGKRVHKPFVITKELDKSTPLLYQALVTNESFSKWILKFYAPAITAASGGGTEKQHYTVELTNASIAAIKFVLPNTKDPETVKLNPYEEIEFVYQKIQWTWTDGGITTIDDWELSV